MPAPIIVGVDTAALGQSPSQTLFTYRILNSATGADKGGLRGVTQDPILVEEINQGSNALTLVLDHHPSELTFGDLIRVNYPDGQIAGRWKYEGVAEKMEGRVNSYALTLIPLVAELTDADFNANYSTDKTQPTSALGNATFSVPVVAAIPRTQHVTAGTVTNNGTAYAYVFNNSTCADPLSQAIIFAGTGWWWRCSHNGVVDLRNSSPFTHVWTIGRDVTDGEWDQDIQSLINGQPVVGGQPSNAKMALTAFAVDTNVGNPYSVPNIGRRTATSYSDSSLMNQAAVNAVATSLLNYGERVSKTKILKVRNYRARRPRVGDATTLRVPSPDPINPDANGYVIEGPYLITKVTEIGATWGFDVEISADMVVPIKVIKPTLEKMQAITKLTQNPVRTAVSPDGNTGTLGAGVLNGSGGGDTYATTPSTPTGLAVSTGVDRVAQTNNAYAAVSWSASTATDAVIFYEVRWRKSTDADVDASYYQARTSAVAIKIPGLTQGLSYFVEVRAVNGASLASDWTSTTFTASADNTAPAVPTGLSAYRTPRGAAVTWNGNTEADLQGYLLQVSISGAPFTPVNAKPNLATSYDYVAPSGTATEAGLVFQLAAVDWTGNQSNYSSVSATTQIDGVYFQELLTGEIQATGTITGGKFQTSASGARAEFDNGGIRLYDGTAMDHGDGPGITAHLNSQTGDAFFSGTVQGATGYNSTGVKLWDSVGLVGSQIISLLGSLDYTYPQTGSITLGAQDFWSDNWDVMTGAEQTISNTTVDFVMPRDGRILLVANITDLANRHPSGAVAGSSAFVRFNGSWGESTAKAGSSIVGNWIGAGGTSSGDNVFNYSFVSVMSPPLGANSLSMGVLLPGGANPWHWEYFDHHIYVFLMGA